MGKTPYIGLLGLLVAGLAVTGCQTSTPRPRAWRENTPPGMIGKGLTPAEKKTTEMVSEKDGTGKPAPDFVNKGVGPTNRTPPLSEGPPTSTPGPMTESKSFAPPPDPTPATRPSLPGRDADGLPVAMPRRAPEPTGLDVPSPPVAVPGRGFSSPSGDRPMPLPTDTSRPAPDLPPVATTTPPAPPVPPGTSPTPGGPPGLGPPPGTTLPPLK